MAKPRVVVLCGAGLSAEVGLPTMARWSQCVQQHPGIKERDRRDLQAIHIECNAILGQVGATAANLEHLASTLEMLRLCRPAFEFQECVEHRTPSQGLRLLRSTICQIYSPDPTDLRHNAGNMIHALVDRASDLHIITTNYDLNIELGAAHLGYAIDVSSEIDRARATLRNKEEADIFSMYSAPSRGRPASRPSPIGLSKLHGSVNWFTLPDGLLVADALKLCHSDDRQSYFRLLSMNEGLVDPTSTCIVAPSITKGDHFLVVGSQWKSAAEAIRAADQLWIIGYSFPASDAFMRYFMATSLRRNTTLGRLVVIDPCASEIVERTAGLFGPPVFAGEIESYPVSWTRLHPYFGSICQGDYKPTASNQLIRQLQDENQGKRILAGRHQTDDLPFDHDIGRNSRARDSRRR
ncbi:MAG: hypothetical protein HUU19_11615 [Phycisphaerales bacterium]|nr:hypothetical protein [Phycisphaerales bacterium]